MKIKKGDKVIVIQGVDKGKTGVVLSVLRDTDRAIVEGIKMQKKHQKSARKGQVGQVIEKPSPVHLSNISLIDPKTNKATRVRFEVRSGKKVRVSVKSGAEV